MKIVIYSITFLFIYSSICGAQNIKLSGRKDRVLRIETREKVLNFSKEHLNPSDDDFLSNIDKLDNPFSFIEEIEKEEETEKPVVRINYDDASVLKVIASNFLGEISGTMARGTSRVLQLEGGGLVKAGYSFPVRIPEIEDRVFNVTITEITEKGIRMNLGDIESFFDYIEEDMRDSIKRDNE